MRGAGVNPDIAPSKFYDGRPPNGREPALGNPQFRTLLCAARIGAQHRGIYMRHLPFVLMLSCAVALARASAAAELDVGSTIDAVTVYPDGAAVTRIIHIDVPAGDSVLFARDFPPSLDPATLRVEGEGRAHLMIG